ncbi:hypothetical protein V5E97_11485 [Singulisphaera sp. Ch08]|uniref:Transposase n=1 Tax=Singulisphaera sp. Ch08 TaxID=3120278 RepID=A0AAU7CMS3_9BACT
MDARPKTRRLNRERNPQSPQATRGAKQIVIPMSRRLYDEIWHDPARLRAAVDGWAHSAPELFPPGFDRGYRLHGFGRESRKLPGLKLRKIVTDDGSSYWLRPGFIVGYMAGTVDELAYPLLLAAHGVPPWLLKIGFGHSEMYWHRVVERLGRSSLVGTTVRDAARLPTHLAADEHHADWAGQKGYVATTVGGGCVLGVALTASADDAHLREAYGVFAAEAHEVEPDYAPETVNTDGWAATRNAFQACFPGITVVLCFLHGFLKIRNRCRQAHELHRKVWEIYRAATAEEFRRRMGEFQQWCATQTWTAPVREMVTKLVNKTESYAVAYDHPGCHRTSNAIDRPMNRLCRLMYAGRGLHGHQESSELRLRGWALLANFRPYAPRGKFPRAFESPAHRLNGKRYHEHWLLNLMVSTSRMGLRDPKPAIR